MKRFLVFIPVLLLILSLAGPLVRGDNPQLLRLFETGDTAGIIKILEADPQQLKADLDQGMTPLHYAVYCGNETVFDYLIKRGLDLHAKDRRGLTPVWFTISGVRPAMLKKLIALEPTSASRTPKEIISYIGRLKSPAPILSEFSSTTWALD